LARPKRRTYTGEYKQQVLAEAEAASAGQAARMRDVCPQSCVKRAGQNWQRERRRIWRSEVLLTPATGHRRVPPRLPLQYQNAIQNHLCPKQVLAV
jgi:hypothetical protein